MNISQIINSSIISKNNFSPNSLYLLVPKGKNLILYSLTPSINKIYKLIFDSTINYIEFSPSSDYFCIILSKKDECIIKSVKNKNFEIKIKEPIFGINAVKWSSKDNFILISLKRYNSLHIFSTLDEYENIEEEFDEKNSLNHSKNYKYIISNIKYQNLSKGISFSYNGNEFMAIAIRKQIKDYIEIYETDKFELISSFISHTIDLDNIFWSKDNSFIILYENSNYDSKLFIYSLSGNLISITEPYKNYMGINLLNISPNGHYITSSYYDNIIRLYHYLSFKLCTSINPDILLFSKNNDNKNKFIFEKTVILVENSKKNDINFDHLYDKEKDNFKLDNTFNKNNTNNNDVNYIRNFCYSFNSQYIAFNSSKYLHLILIYDINKFKLSYLLIFETNVIDFIWSPSSLQLVICTENDDKIYFFQPQRVKGFKLPNNKDNNSFYINSNNNKDIKERNVYFSNDGKKVLYKKNKYNFFLIEPGNDI